MEESDTGLSESKMLMSEIYIELYVLYVKVVSPFIVSLKEECTIRWPAINNVFTCVNDIKSPKRTDIHVGIKS